MVMHPQFIKNLGEHIAQEFFNMNQEYCGNSHSQMLAEIYVTEVNNV